MGCTPSRQRLYCCRTSPAGQHCLQEQACCPGAEGPQRVHAVSPSYSNDASCLTGAAPTDEDGPKAEPVIVESADPVLGAAAEGTTVKPEAAAEAQPDQDSATEGAAPEAASAVAPTAAGPAKTEAPAGGPVWTRAVLPGLGGPGTLPISAACAAASH